MVALPDPGGHTLCNLAMGELPILEDATPMTFTNPYSHKKCSIKRTQLPIVPAFAMTTHKSQGKTLPTAIMDIQSCCRTESVYVMLSRVTSIERLHILRPFNIKKIQCCPSVDSWRETLHLSILEVKSWSHGQTIPQSPLGANLASQTFCVPPDNLEDLEQLDAIQDTVSSLELPKDCVEPQVNKRPSGLEPENWLLKKRCLNLQ